MLRCVIIIRENLCKQHVHVICLLMLPRISPIWNAYLTTWQGVSSLSLFWNLIFHAFFPEVEHFTCESLRHYAVTRCTSDLIQRIIWVWDSMWSFRFNLFYYRGSIISCVLWWPIEIGIWQIGRTRVIKTCCSLKCRIISVYLSHIYPGTKTSLWWIEVSSCLEGLIHLINCR